ncbi:Uncharacterised protein [Chlamydia trachomatis]|nr:Uncharacterised protein [Chlamydia trachomatis]CRH71157.1 Uncharacterised protein [Chlamydia trachomatis]
MFEILGPTLPVTVKELPLILGFGLPSFNFG